jgi:hypothetical protein
MRSAIAATAVVAAGLFAANMLGVAVAEAPTGTPLRTISVQGIGTARIGQFDNATAATAVYREGAASAIADGQSKAAFLASKVGATLGVPESVIEEGGYIECAGAQEDEYEGEQPDFGSAPLPSSSSVPIVGTSPAKESSSVTRTLKRKRSKPKHPKAKKAGVAACTLTARVSLVYPIS